MDPDFVRDVDGNIIDAKPRLRAVRQSDPPPSDRLPQIRIDEPLDVQGDKAIAALAAEENLYQQAGHLVRVVRLDPSSATAAKPDGTPEIRRAESETIRELLARWARWERFNTKEKELVSCHPPKDVAAAVRKRGEWPGIRPLESVLEAPCLRPDGTVLARPGYDEQLRSILLPGADFPTVRDEPEIEHARKALKALVQPFEEFPWSRPEELYVPIAAILTLYARPAIRGAIPAIVFDSSVAGSGKTLASGTVHAAYTGRWSESNTYPEDHIELEKSLAGEAMAGSPVVDWDNVEGHVEPPPLLKVLTARDKVRMRVMGANTKVSLRWRSLIMLNGVNLVIGRQMSRRCIVARMEPNQERPEERQGFKLNLPEWTPRNRTRLGVAALTILRAYCHAGKPTADVPLLGSFEEWAALVPRAIVWAGGLDVTRCRPSSGASGDDPDTAALRVILPAWERLGGVQGMGTAEALRVLYPGGKRPAPHEGPPDGFEDLRDALEALCGGRRPGGIATPSAEGLRYKLRSLKGRWLGVKRLMSRDASDGKGPVRWAVETASKPGG